MEDAKKNEIEFLSRKLLELNKQLIESEKAKTAFLSLVANELNNPLTALLGMIPHLKPAIEDPKEKMFDLMHEEALNLDFRIQNIVEAAKIESGIYDLTYANVNVETLLQEVLESLKYLIRTNRVVLILDIQIDKPVVTDPYKLYLMMKNVVANACMYGEMGGLIEIIASSNDEHMIFMVKNQGERPNVEFKPQIFTRFAYGPDGKHGLGLGLSVVRYLCDSLSGSIDYTWSEGSVSFTITLPHKGASAESSACGSNEFLFESFDDALEL